MVLDDAVTSCELVQHPTASAFLESLSLAAQPRAHLMALYQGWIDCLGAFQAACVTGRFVMPTDSQIASVRRDALAEHERLTRQISGPPRAGRAGGATQPPRGAKPGNQAPPSRTCRGDSKALMEKEDGKAERQDPETKSAGHGGRRHRTAQGPLPGGVHRRKIDFEVLKQSWADRSMSGRRNTASTGTANAAPGNSPSRRAPAPCVRARRTVSTGTRRRT